MMKSLRTLLLALMVGFLLPGLGSAEFFRYKNPDGVWVYTENLDEVPEDQRPKTYEGVNDNLTEREKAAKKAEKDAKAAERRKKWTTPGTGSRLSSNTDRAFASLKAEEDALADIAGKLKTEQDAILKIQAAAKTTEEEIQANLKMLELNKKVQAYEDRRLSYEKKVDAYNRMVERKIKD